MDFNQRLQRAIQRGENTRDVRGRAAAEREMSAEEIKSLHSRSRLSLVDRIEDCLRKLADHFPGFEYQSVMSDSGWGARISRDDLSVDRGRGASFYSRFEIVVSPLGNVPIIEVVAKGTIRNKEVFHRRNYQQLTEADLDSFQELIDIWVLEYAELYAAAH
jgi:hypothetical protein